VIGSLIPETSSLLVMTIQCVVKHDLRACTYEPIIIDRVLRRFQSVERSLIIIKPDAVQRGLIGPIITRLERRGLKIVGMKFIHIDEPLARRHYAVHEGKPFFPGLIRYITSAPVIVMVVEGRKAIEIVRRTLGATRPAEAAPGTIRADFSLEVGRNLVHGSDGPETAAFEIALFFDDDELVSWGRDTDRWIFE
jgi:nucleoside-diphosphate kinase